MALTQSHAAIWQKAKSLGGGDQAVALSDEMCSYLLGRMVLDLNRRADFPEIPARLPPLLGNQPAAELVLPGINGKELFERIISKVRDAETYFACLAALQKARSACLCPRSPRLSRRLRSCPPGPWQRGSPYCSSGSSDSPRPPAIGTRR